MKSKIFKFLGAIILILIVAIGIFYSINNEKLPEGKQGEKADTLANKMLKAMNHKAYKNTEVLEWSFRDKHHYKWIKRENIVIVKWDNHVVHLFLNQPEKNMLFNKELERNVNPDSKIFKQAQDYFNNDSFWLVAPHKVFDSGTERRIVNYNDKDALLVTYTSGGSTPGDSYLWILDENGFPTEFKMWTQIIPIGGVSATWSDWKTTKTGIKLPTKHTLSLFGMELSMGNVKSTNVKADILARKILKAIKHEAYKKTRFLEWSFAGKRHFKWDKEKHIVDVSWDSVRVNLHPNNLEKSTVFYNNKQQKTTDTLIVKKAWNIFNNDSFWLVAPHKLFESGIIRTIKKINNKDALFVKYTTGGSTPGDSYLWTLNNKYMPTSYKMYVPSMKMNGVPATWEGWITTKSGTLLPTNHSFNKGGQLSMGTVKGYN
ncbi:hypothetical protein [Tenacibaculum insulae]|uniref:hypothetical protein n=1 Tax=Tenacibaculum insulae TaxID=2029677 RepID=UPI003AB5BA8F